MKFKPATVCVMAVWGFVTAAGCFAVDPTTEHTKWLLLVVAFGEVSYVDKIGEKVLPPEIANNRANSSSDTGSSHFWYSKKDYGLGPPTPLHARVAPQWETTYPKSLIVVIPQSTWLVWWCPRTTLA